MGRVERTSTVSATVKSDRPAPAQAQSGRVDRAAEDAALAFVARGRHEDALKVLMTAYGAPIMAFALRVVRNREAAQDVRQQVFLEAFQGIAKFQGLGSLWRWLSAITYHRCLDELRRTRRSGAVEDIDAIANALVGGSDQAGHADRIAKRRALEACLGKLSVSMRSQLLMHYLFDLTYAEIGEAIGAPHGTVQVRMSRVLPRLRRCLQGEGAHR